MSGAGRGPCVRGSCPPSQGVVSLDAQAFVYVHESSLGMVWGWTPQTQKTALVSAVLLLLMVDLIRIELTTSALRSNRAIHYRSNKFNYMQAFRTLYY